MEENLTRSLSEVFSPVCAAVKGRRTVCTRTWGPGVRFGISASGTEGRDRQHCATAAFLPYLCSMTDELIEFVVKHIFCLQEKYLHTVVSRIMLRKTFHMFARGTVSRDLLIWL